jgi:hypothetical protein
MVRAIIFPSDVPLDFISWVQPWISSWISSGATSLRAHDSSQRGFGCATGASYSPTLEPERGLSFDLKTFLKKGILCGRGVPGCMRSRRRRQSEGRGQGAGRVDASGRDGVGYRATAAGVGAGEEVQQRTFRRALGAAMLLGKKETRNGKAEAGPPLDGAKRNKTPSAPNN